MRSYFFALKTNARLYSLFSITLSFQFLKLLLSEGKSPNLTWNDLKLPIWCIELAKEKYKVKKNEKIDGEEEILSILSSLKDKEESQKAFNWLEKNIMDKLLLWFPHISETMPIEAPIYSILVITLWKSIGNNVCVGPVYSMMKKLNVLIKTDLNKLLDSERKLYHWKTAKAKTDFTSLIWAINFILSKDFKIGISDENCKTPKTLIRRTILDKIEIDIKTLKIITNKYVKEKTNKLFEILNKCNMTLSIPFQNRLKKKDNLIIEKQTLDPKRMDWINIFSELHKHGIALGQIGKKRYSTCRKSWSLCTSKV